MVMDVKVAVQIGDVKGKSRPAHGHFDERRKTSGASLRGMFNNSMRLLNRILHSKQLHSPVRQKSSNINLSFFASFLTQIHHLIEKLANRRFEFRVKERSLSVE